MILQQELYKTSIDILWTMAWESKPTCDFLFGFFQCALLEGTIDIELTARMVKGIHSYRKDHTSEQVTCSPRSRQMKPFPSLRKKIGAFEEEKNNKNSPFYTNPFNLPRRMPQQEIQGEVQQKK